MRLDHLLSREKAQRETGRLIPRSIVASQEAMQKKDRKVPRLTAFFLFTLYRFQGSLKETSRPKFHPEPTSKEAGSRYGKWVKGDSPRTLTTAYERKDEIKRLVISVQFNDANHWARKDWS